MIISSLVAESPDNSSLNKAISKMATVSPVSRVSLDSKTEAISPEIRVSLQTETTVSLEIRDSLQTAVTVSLIMVLN